MNVHNIPPLLANAVIRKPDEPALNASSSSSSSSNDNATTIPASSDDSQMDSSNSSSSKWQQQTSTSQDSTELIDESNASQPDRSTESYPPSMANFLPDNSFFYNEKNCYIFPGAEIWWNKDSDDVESTTSSDSSIVDDDDVDDDIEDMELSTIERNEIMSDVETTIAVDNLLENTNEHEFNKYLLKRNANTSLENIHLEESEIDELSPKRLRTQQSSTTTTLTTTTTTVIDQLHVEHNTSTMCETLDSSSSNSNSSSSDPSLPQNEVFSPKL